MRAISEQEKAWTGEFGDEYTQRNASNDLVPQRTQLWANILRTIPEGGLSSICEIGAGTGQNLDALSRLTRAGLIGIEPNESARRDCSVVRDPSPRYPPCISILDGTAQNTHLSDGAVDLAFTCGVLIHIPPDELGEACDEIYRISSRYIVCAEYFSDQPQSKQYRGCDNLLFTRDFGSYWLDRYPDLTVMDYGFAWKRMTGLDNINWTLFSKRLK